MYASSTLISNTNIFARANKFSFFLWWFLFLFLSLSLWAAKFVRMDKDNFNYNYEMRWKLIIISINRFSLENNYDFFFKLCTSQMCVVSYDFMYLGIYVNKHAMCAYWPTSSERILMREDEIFLLLTFFLSSSSSLTTTTFLRCACVWRNVILFS